MQTISSEFTAPSKSFNLAGLLCSNAIFHNAKVKQEFDIAAAKTGGSTVNHLGMVACMAAYARCEDWFEEMLAVVRRNLDTVRAFADTHDGIRLIEPEEPIWHGWIAGGWAFQMRS